MDADNPYSAPRSELSSPAMAALPSNSQGADLSQVVRSFQETKPWLRLISIAGFLGLGLAGIGFLAAALLGGGPAFISVVTIVILIVNAVPVIQIHLYANAIDELVRTPDVAHLDAAVRRQRMFWMTIGVLFLLGMVFSIGSAVVSAIL
ncbi:MAG: hypothetical protein AAFQ82_23885 [Myxococcota bacterium]